MYTKLQPLSMGEQVEFLTKALVKKKSYNHTEGEREKADFILSIIRSFPYFKAHPELAWFQEIENDKLQRRNVFAFIKGKKQTNKTIIYHAHYDTVGTEDYGALQNISNDSDALLTYFSQYDGDAELRREALSGEWLFGRGSLDMQSGIAIHLVNLLYFSNHLDELEGNLLVLFNPDEENQHVGIRGALSEFVRLKEKKSLEYVAAINNDFISPLYDGDVNKYIYTGGAGKLLACFYIAGREAHVGESLLGIDPTLIAGELNQRINQNFQLVEKLPDDLVLPPSCLYLKEDKKSYDVQTPVSCRTYFNYFIYNKTPKNVLEDLTEIAKKACQSVEHKLKENFDAYREANGLPERQIHWKVGVTTLESYLQYLQEKNIDPKNTIEKIVKNCLRSELDDRMIAFQIVEALHNLDPEKNPKVILFFAPPFLPSNTLTEDERDLSIKACIQAVLDEEGENLGEPFKLRKYFPYLCDGSFLSFNGSIDDIHSVINNFPAMNELFPIPLKEMKSLNIPALNFGVYGKGGHKWTERVYKPYSFHVLPTLIRKVTNRLLSL
ncbi:M20/M25/M40 family metallo-hydrolase [Bacillus sp. 03113]|uniref:M20/M25/M40 family metallo-hydrolase n=1 Tax=Bacillus sp. 03113 TaxID=2578211 RepID=UPI0011445B70|nr:M20/M25/M40 family metallo-hydrolase [Bacillus sp. 03113]